MKTLNYLPPKRRHYRTSFSTRQEVVEMAGYIKCKADVKALCENPGKFLEEKRILKSCTDSASDRAFIGLAKQLKSSIC
jgi:hypothetical protein